MKRPLVTASDSPKHPFRRGLPFEVLALSPKELAEKAQAPRSEDHDWKLFLLSFAAFFTVAYTFIA